MYQDTSSDDLRFFGNSSNRMTITSAGNVGIGTSSPSAPIEISRSDAGIIQYITNTGSNQAYTAYGNSDNPPWSQNFNTPGGLLVGIDTDETAVVYQGGNKALRFGTNAAERMRIDSSGNLLVGTTSAVGTVTIGGAQTPAQPALYMQTYPTGHPTAYIYRNNTDAQYCLKLRHDGPVSGSGNGYMVLFTDRNDSTVGSITVSGSTTAYNTSSDARLKENIADAEDASSLVDAIKVRQFDWKADGSHQDYGMVAQELLTVAPEAVSGDPESDDMMGVDYSKLVPMMIKEIQSLRREVAALKENN
jgi:hypothetical protein